MLFSVCGLLPDMVRAMPVWVDDPEIRKSIWADVEVLQKQNQAREDVEADAEERAKPSSKGKRGCENS